MPSSTPSSSGKRHTTELQHLNHALLIMRDGMRSNRPNYTYRDYEKKVFKRMYPPHTVNNEIHDFSRQSRSHAHPTITWHFNETVQSWTSPSDRQEPMLSDDEDLHDMLLLGVVKYVHSGRTWDVFRGHIRRADLSDPPTPVIIKLTCLNTFPEDFTPNILDWDPDSMYIRSSALHAILNEDYIYRAHLQSVQGDLVPYYYGCFVWKENENADQDDWVFATVLEDAGDLVDPTEFIGLEPLNIKREIVSAVESLHQQTGIVHASLDPNHILERWDNKQAPPNQFIAFIDFEDSQPWNWPEQAVLGRRRGSFVRKPGRRWKWKSCSYFWISRESQ